MATPMPKLSRLSYECQPFGTLSHRGVVELVCPTPGAWHLFEEGVALVISTGLMLAFSILALNGGVGFARSDGGFFLLMLLGMGVFAQWIVMLSRFMKMARHTPRAIIQVTPTELIVFPANASAASVRRWRQSDIAGLRLDVIRRSRWLPCIARFQIVTRQGAVFAMRTSWRNDEPPGPHERRLRQALGLAERVRKLQIV